MTATRVLAKTRVYRVHGGMVDAWRRYRVTVNGNHKYHLADSQLLEITGTVHRLKVSAGEYVTKDFHVSTKDDSTVVCVFTTGANRVRNPRIHLEMKSEDEVQQLLLRFDRPPYYGGLKAGLIQVFLAMLIPIGFFLVMAVIGIAAIIEHPSSTVIIVPILVVVTAFCWFVVATGLRSLYYYFRLPKEWRH